MHPFVLVPDALYPVPVGEGRWFWTTAAIGAASGAFLLGSRSRSGAAVGALVGAWLAAKYFRAR